MSTLILHCPRTRHGTPLWSCDPWRLALRCDDGTTVPLWWDNCPIAFPRKRDGAPVLAALEALGGDWGLSLAHWPVAQQQAVQTILEGTAAYQAWHALVTEGARALGGRES